MYKLNNKLLNNQLVKEEIKRNVRKYFAITKKYTTNKH